MHIAYLTLIIITLYLRIISSIPVSKSLSADDAADAFRKFINSGTTTGSSRLQPRFQKLPIAKNTSSTSSLKAAQQSTKNVKVPQYMLDLFDMVSNSNGISRPDIPIEGNLVRSFFNEAVPPSDGNTRPTTIKYYFNINDIEQSESVMKAELRLFKLKHHKKAWRHSEHLYRLEIVSLYDHAIIYEGISSENENGWQTYSLTNLVQQWVAFPATNKGLQITLTGVGRSSVHVRFGKDTDDNKEPILVVFSDDNQSRTPLKYVNNKTNSAPADDATNGLSQRRMMQPTSMGCKRVDMIVDFAKIEWDSWILQPKVFNAYQCQGRCGIYASKDQKQTNHATIQAILAETGIGDDQGVKEPCCTPKKFDSTALLLYERFKDSMMVKLKTLDDMIVSECGCA